MTPTAEQSDGRYFGSMSEACDLVLAPLKAWARTGFAAGALDLAASPTIARPPIVSARVLNEVWERALGKWDASTMDDADKAEASARFEFVHALMNRVMTRESEIRDLYYKERLKGMAVRTAALCAAVAAWTALTIVSPWWLAFPATFLIGVALGCAWKRLSSQLRAAPRPDDPVKIILSVLPWSVEGMPAPR